MINEWIDNKEESAWHSCSNCHVRSEACLEFCSPPLGERNVSGQGSELVHPILKTNTVMKQLVEMVTSE